MTPKNLRHMLKKLLTLQFSEEPPYDWITETLKKEIKADAKFGPDMQPIKHHFEWTQSHAK